MKVLSLLLTLALLVLADRLAADLKQAGTLPALKKPQAIPLSYRSPGPAPARTFNSELNDR